MKHSTHKKKTGTQFPRHTVKNDHLITADYRKELRKLKLEEFRQKVDDRMTVIDTYNKEKEKRIDLIVEQINSDVQETLNFLNTTSEEYDRMLEQYSPPEERSIDEIVADIDAEFREVYDTFKEEFEFKAELPDPETLKTKPDQLQDLSDFSNWQSIEVDVEKTKEKCRRNAEREGEVLSDISRIKADIDMENVRFSAHRHERDEKIFENQRLIEKLQRDIARESATPLETIEVDDLTKEIQEIKEEIEQLHKWIHHVEELKAKALGKNK